MSLFSDWPEIAPVLPATPATGEPPVLRVEHAVWGKVHGARSDFRWIARSPDFPQDPDLPRQLNLGAEDQPVRTQLWRNLHGRCYAVSCYPSRATDWSGRTGFLEKQILAWEPAVGLPAALGALLLLPEVACRTDEVWWDRCEGEPWQDPGFALPLPAPGPIPVEESQVEASLIRGIEALHAVLQANSLEAYFLRLLGRLRPAGLTGLSQPLPPEALAALLAPLPGMLADRVSLAGWISGHASRDDLARWDAVVLPPELAGTAEPEVQVSPVDRERASTWARRLLLLPEPMEELRPSPFSVAEPSAPVRRTETRKPAPRESRRSSSVIGLPGRTIDLEPPSKEISPLFHELYAFARAVDHRWIDPEASSLKKKLREATHYKPAPASLLPSWIEALEAQRPEDVDKDQWTVKLDLLRSAAVVLFPDPTVWKKVGLPRSPRIPALFFALLLESSKQRDTLGGLGEALLRQTLEQSVECTPSRWASKVRDMLGRWQVETNRRDTDIRRLIEIALGTRAPQRAVL